MGGDVVLAALLAVGIVSLLIVMRQDLQRRESAGDVSVGRPLWLKLALVFFVGTGVWIAGNVFVRGVIALLG